LRPSKNNEIKENKFIKMQIEEICLPNNVTIPFHDHLKSITIKIPFSHFSFLDPSSLAVRGKPNEIKSRKTAVQPITAAASNSAVKLRCATHYCCTTGGAATVIVNLVDLF